MKKIVRHRLMLVGLYLLIGLLLSTLGRAQVQTKNLEVVDEKTTLNREELSAFKTLAAQKVNELENYVSTIGDKSEPDDFRELARKNAVKLFIDTATIEVSKVVNGKVVSVAKRPIAEYFIRLKALPYAKVKITYYDVAYISDYERNDKGEYTAHATIFQQFEGLDKSGRLRYKDKQAKDVSVLLTDLMDEFYQFHRWTLRLGNIKLTETR